jgi:hypothetical protein
MRARYFLLGVLVGLLLAPASGSQSWRQLRDQLVTVIDALLRLLAPRREPVAVRRTLTAL